MPRTDLQRRGLMLVLSSPSGAGKTTLARMLLDNEPTLTMSVSVTTRPIRPGEVDGEDYIFVTEAEFSERLARGEFLEHAQVFGHSYGTPAAEVEAMLVSGQDVLFDIDWQGTQQMKASAQQDLVAVFVLPPSVEELGERLQKRARDSAEEIARRMAKAADEMSHWPEYQYVIINEDAETAHRELRAILTAERLRRERQTGLLDFVQKLRQVD